VRLPSEAEWEYACRAGSDTTYCFVNSADQLDQYGWYRDNSGMASHPVGGKQPNAWGLYDLHGGIDEFVRDNWHETLDDLPGDGSARIAGGAAEYRTLRGGSWYDRAEYCASGQRDYPRDETPSEDDGVRGAVEIVLGSI
jgi:formylglycine-generating enzyme required for sulfatase activity